MMYVEFKCECGAMNCSGNPDFDEPKCHKCGLLGSWFPDFDEAMIMPDDPIPVFEDAIIMPDDPMPLKLMERIWKGVRGKELR